MVGVGRGATVGVLVKNAEALEVMEKVDTLLVDKTGTLTEGKPKVVAVIPSIDISEDELLRLAASVERGSEHPLAAAIVLAAESKSLRLSPAEQFESRTGRGVVAQIDGRRVALGNLKLVEELGIDSSPVRERAEDLRREGQTAMFVTVGEKVAGIVAVADPIKRSTAEAIASEPVAGVYLKCSWNSDRCRPPVPGLWSPAQPNDCERRNDVQFGFRDQQRAAIEASPAVSGGSTMNGVGMVEQKGKSGRQEPLRGMAAGV